MNELLFDIKALNRWFWVVDYFVNASTFMWVIRTLFDIIFLKNKTNQKEIDLTNN